MTHAITRTNPLGVTPAVGRCTKCGAEGLSFADALVECPADELVSNEQALIDLLDDAAVAYRLTQPPRLH